MKLVVIGLVAFLMMTFVVDTESKDSAADQFLREVIAARAERNEFPSMLVRENAPAQYCCKICTTGKACGDTCIARDKACRVGPGCACDG